MATDTTAEVLSALEAAGTAQNRRIYRRHGGHDPMFGVSYAELNRLQKRIGRDHELALGLWASGNHDARILACRVADPDRMSRSDLDRWVRAANDYMISDAVAGLAAAGPHRESRAEKWIADRREFVAHAGWALVASQAMDASVDLGHDHFVDRLRRIERDMATAPNRTRHAMHMTLIAIGGRTPGLRRLAVATARRLGTPEVDHGETNCTTPEAIPYIERMWERRPAGSAR